MQTVIGPVGSRNTLLEDISLTGPLAPVNSLGAIDSKSLFHGSTIYDAISSGEIYPTRCESALNVSKDRILREESLSERLNRIETVLNIPTRDLEMENKYPRLKQLFEEYMQELEKLKTWERLND